MTVDESLDMLQMSMRNLKAKTEDCAQQIRNTLKPGALIPSNCPSQASMAVLILDDMKTQLAEVQGVVIVLEKAIWETQKK